MLLASWVLVLPISVKAQTIESIETQPNNTFGDRVTVSSGVNRIYGELTPIDLPPADYVTENSLEVGTVDEITLTNLPPGQSFWAWVTMENDARGYVMDPIMGVFDAEGNLSHWDDDSSPTSSLAPAIRGTVAEDGTLKLKVSGLGDDDFDGNQTNYYGNEGEGEDLSTVTEPHSHSGDYTLSIITNTLDLQGDVDFFTLSGLTPGHSFVVAESMSEGGIRLGWFNENGAVSDVSEASEMTYREQISGVVPATGQLHLAVTGYDDVSFDGQHNNSGEYVLRVEIHPLD